MSRFRDDTMDLLKVECEVRPDGVAVLTVRGTLDAHTYETLEAEIRRVFDGGTYRLAVDLSQLEYMSSGGAGVFIHAFATARQHDGNLALVLPGSGLEIFESLGLSRVMPIRRTREEAVRFLLEEAP